MTFTEPGKSYLKTSVDEIIKDATTPKDKDHADIPALILGVTDRNGNVYLNGGGVRNINTGTPVHVDDRLCYFSCTKSITVMGLLKLYEEGKVDLDAPVSKYLPEISEIGLIEPESVNEEDGTYLIEPRPPKNAVTVRHLLLHTAGFSYGFLNYDYFLLATKNRPDLDLVNPTKEFFSNLKTPLVHEPGTKWMYGYNIDWLGFVIQKIAGKKLGEYLHEVIFEPAGLSTTFHPLNDSSLVRLHLRRRNGNFRLLEGKQTVSLDPELDLGGQGAFGSVGDYLKFMRIWLNYGLSPDTGKRILKEDTVKFAIKNHLPAEIDMEFPGLTTNKLQDPYNREGYTLSGNAYISNDLPSGISKGSIYWSGAANLFYWIDFKNGVAGFFGGQIFPFLDPKATAAYEKFEESVYNALKGAKGKL